MLYSCFLSNNNNHTIFTELRQFQNRRPTKDDVVKLLSENGWSNCIIPRGLKSWKPRETRQSKKSDPATDRCLTQEWPGLCIVQNETRGRVVCTTQPFQQGDIVTDYHGEVLHYGDGLKRQGNVEEGGFIMFLKEQGIAIDATKEEYICHPGKPLYGWRFISHSKKGKRTNLMPKMTMVNECMRCFCGCQQN